MPLVLTFSFRRFGHRYALLTAKHKASRACAYALPAASPETHPTFTLCRSAPEPRKLFRAAAVYII